MPNNNVGRAANDSAGQPVSPSLTSRIDIFSRSLRDVFGVGRREARDADASADDAQPARAPAKIQPVIPSLYPAAAPPEPPKPLAPPLRLDVRTKALLESFAAATPERGGANAELAQALLVCEQAPMTEHELAHYRGAVQRLTLVARMIDSIESDPYVPEGFRNVFDRLRFTLMKSVLADADFLSQRGHPLRAIAAGLAMRAATAPQWDLSVERELATALDNAVRDFDLSAGFVRPIVKRLQPLALDTVREFMRQMQVEREERAAAVGARRHVEEQIRLRLQGAVLDARLRYVIETEWKEVLVWQLTTFGMDSAEWRAGLAVVEELLKRASSIQSGALIPPDLVKTIATGLADAGRESDTVVATLETLRHQKPAADTVATEFARVAMKLSPLSRLMEAQGWFRVFDHGQQKMRWLQARSYDPSNNTVTFGGMDGGDALVMHAQQFLGDLKRGLSAPNQPDEQTNELISELRAAA